MGTERRHRVRRVLIAAENASTHQGGEAILPYHLMRLLRQRGIDTHLVVHERCRADLEEVLAEELDRIHFVRDMWVQKLLFRLGRLVPRRVGEATFGLATNLLTQWAQRKILRTLAVEDTVVHQPIPVAPRFPSLLFGLGAPVVMGPLNGGMEYPPAFRRQESLASRVFIGMARLLTNAVNALLPGKRRAAVVLVANERTRRALPSGLRGQVLELVENGVDTAVWSDGRSDGSPDGAGRFVFIGRLVDWKALDLVLEALKSVPDATLDIIGDGSMLASWRGYAETAGVGLRVRFWGWLSQAECAEYLRDCCALVLPSLYECGGAVVLEAMAMARPVIATAWGGPLDYLDETCGILVPPASREALISGFADAMRGLMSSPERCARMGAAGRERLLREFDWNRKIDRMLEIYDSALVDSTPASRGFPQESLKGNGS
jgi:glycosyltransferase involved in cell wall biosynthesis